MFTSLMVLYKFDVFMKFKNVRQVDKVKIYIEAVGDSP